MNNCTSYKLSDKGMKGTDILPENYVNEGELCANCGKPWFTHRMEGHEEKPKPPIPDNEQNSPLNPNRPPPADDEDKLGLVRCPQCQCLTTKEELAMFNGFCEDCREEQEGDYD